MKKTLLFIIFLCFFSSNAFASVTGYASTTYNSSFAALYALDGNSTTKWYSSSTSILGQWYAVEFGASDYLSQISISWAAPSYGMPLKYDVQISSNPYATASWNTVMSADMSAGQSVHVLNITPVNARCVRILSQSATTTPSGNQMGIAEIDFVFTPPVTPPPDTGGGGTVSPAVFTAYSTKLQALQTTIDDWRPRMLDGAYILGGLLAIVFAVTWKG